MKLFPPTVLMVCLLFGCATQAPFGEGELNAQQLGVAHYFPQAHLKWKQVSKSQYISTISTGKPANAPSGQDAFLVGPLEALLFYCPALRLAQRDGYQTASVLKWLPVHVGDAGQQVEITLTTENILTGKVKGEGRVEAVNFVTKELWGDMGTVCDRAMRDLNP